MANTPRCGYRLQPLLNRLLSMEADDAVGYLWIGRELADRRLILFRLLKSRIREVSPRSRCGKDAAFPEGTMEKGAWHVAPLVCLTPAVDDQIDRDIEPSQLPAKPPILLPPAREVRLDDQQVQIAVRPSHAPCTRPEENDVGIGSSAARRRPASSIRASSVIAITSIVVAIWDGRRQLLSVDARAISA